MSDHIDGLARLPRRTFTGAALAMLAATMASAKATATAMDAAPAAPRNRPRLIAPGGPVRVEGLDELVGEIHLACPVGAASPTALRLVDVERGDTFALFDEAALKRRLARVDDDRILIHVELRSRPGRPLPIRLRPVVAWDADRETETETEGEMHVVSAQGATVFGPPLRDGLWVAIHDPAWERGHRRVGFQQPDRWTIPGRHAIDFVQVDADGRIARGDADRPGNHFGYGAPVLAVADGIVSAARNDMAEATSITGNRRHPLIDAPGNHVILSLAGRGHVLYEHLRPGSLTVRPGDRVRQGQVLGELGFTGDSTGPHLHLHLCDEGAPNSGEGLPFVFDRFERLGGYDDLATLGRARWQAAPEGIATVRLREKPASHRVIRFTAA
ncbi:M23 family metallopeptidase [Roseateles sp.]|uniref:M23 family metallopeptidase n=1 Tax=Roseateles sp. TaxID=1971397 RepID=UPI002F40940F